MAYKPQLEAALLLDAAYGYVQSVPYEVTARWVFYRLLQDGTFEDKSDYKKLLRVTSKARKNFYKDWRPWTLTDDTRSAHVRGAGFSDPASWMEAIRENGIACNLDRWDKQETYVEIWFEAAAMFAQFAHYADENITLLAFHGDISVPPKWKCAERIYERLLEGKTVKVFYYGDLDLKGLQIPQSAINDVRQFIVDKHSFVVVKLRFTFFVDVSFNQH